MPDLEKIKTHLAAISEAVTNLEKQKGISVNDIRNNLDLLWIIERGIYLSIQNLFDILAHIVSADFNSRWESYSEIAEALEINKVITEKERDILFQMAGFRNRLSHHYLSLDPEILIQIVNEGLEDIKHFQSLVIDYCKI